MDKVIQFKKKEEVIKTNEKQDEILGFVEKAASGFVNILSACSRLEAENDEYKHKLNTIAKLISFESRKEFHEFIAENKEEIYGDDLLDEVRVVVLQYLIATDRKKLKKVSKNS